MPITIRSYQPVDLPALAGAAVAVAGAPVPYPPPEAGCTPDTVTGWLTSGTALARWVALLDGTVVGHVQVTAAHDYLTGHLATTGLGPVDVEVARLFVDPSAHGTGAGRALLDTAVTWSRARGLRSGLAVIDGSAAAEALYRRVGLTYAGSFVGIHGTNHVYVDPPSPHPGS